MKKPCLCSALLLAVFCLAACLPPDQPVRLDLAYTPSRETLPAMGELARGDTWRPTVPPPTKTPTVAPTATRDYLDGKANWRGIVCGEAGGGFPDGARLVAWTLRKWQLQKGYDTFGPWNGWNGWCDDPDPATWEWREPDGNVWRAVDEAWGAPLSDAPFDFMRSGNWCVNLGSGEDVKYWERHGERTTPPDFILPHPREKYKQFTLNCYFTRGNWVEASK